MASDEKSSLRPPNAHQFHIPRKAVSNPCLAETYHTDCSRASRPPSPTIRGVTTISSSGLPPPKPPRPSFTSQELSDRDARSNTPVQRAVTDVLAQSPSPSALQSSQSSGSGTFQKAYGETLHFLGGLIHHPAESNKHFTILRHSPGVIFYRGSTTSITVSIFSDAPLPPDRSLWLQVKGFTGKTGMRAKALLRLNGDWLNVTPSVALRPDQVDPNDERAWQRDIAKFQKKAPARVRDTHRLRETAVARIPVEAGDGYFQLVLCHGQKTKVLCRSPVFRILSTSFSPSSIRGASLSTLPLEMGAMVIGSYANTAAQTVISPVKTVVQQGIAPYKPSWVAQTAAVTAYGLGTSAMQSNSDGDGNKDSAAGFTRSPEESISIEGGPAPPYPIDFKARGEILHERGPVHLPILRLSKVPDIILERLHGFFFGWARFVLNNESGKGEWYQVVLSLRDLDPSQLARVNISQAMSKVTTLRFIDEVQLNPRTTVEVRVMGYLRPDVPPPTGMTEKELLEARDAAAEAALLADACDTSYVQGILEYPAWGPEEQRGTSGIVDRTKKEYSSMRARGQNVIEKAPLHWLGVRSPTAEMRDKQITMNGLYIVR